ncbi:solute carrier family 2, facilitated glucose transporter member 3-like [Ptychodera flava]|uniref:solute carrier family 2, facilitated glucose transporter member 3-like n=1 Tax=Ptychodera flava TaxID=63121 RepID=UPI00396A7E66
MDQEYRDNQGHVTVPLVFSTAAAVCGSFQFGYNTGVINSPQMVIEDFINDTSMKRTGEPMPQDKIQFLWSVIVAIFAIGGMIGSLCAGAVANAMGRRGGMLFSDLFSIIGGLLMLLSKTASSYEMIIVGRLIIGFYCGLSTGLVPMYLSEVAPTNLRGALGVCHQLFVTIGILVAQVLGLSEILGNSTYWPLLLGLTMVPAVYQLLTFPFCPESPRYLLLNKQRDKECEKALVKLRGMADVSDDIDEMKFESEKEKSEEKIGIIELFRRRSLRRPLTISIILQLSQQLSGINVVLYYSTLVFVSAGVSEVNSRYATVGTGAALVLVTLISVPLMDKAGRRTLHLCGLGVMFLAGVVLTISLLLTDVWKGAAFISILSVIVFVTAFGIGPGSIPWLIVAELFSQGPRPAAISVAFLVNWTANFLVGITFPSLLSAMKAYVFLPYVALLAIFWLYTFKFVPETKNKSFEEIAAIFRQESLKSYYGSTGRDPKTANTAFDN